MSVKTPAKAPAKSAVKTPVKETVHVTSAWHMPALIAAGVVIIVLIWMLAAKSQNASLVSINGTPVTEGEFVKALKHRYGDSLLSEMINDRLIRLQATRKQVTLSDSEIEQMIGFQRFNTFLRGSSLEKELEDSGLTMDDLRENMTTQALIIKLVVPEADRKAAFQKMGARLSYPPQFKFRQMVFTNKEYAQKALAALNETGEEEAHRLMEATQFALDAEAAKQEQYYMPLPGQNDPDLDKALMTLQPGQVSTLLPLPAKMRSKETANFCRLVQLLDVTPGEQATYENRNMVIGMILLQQNDKKYAMAQRDLLAEALSTTDVYFQTPDYQRARNRFQQTKMENQPVRPVDPNALPTIPGSEAPAAPAAPTGGR
jgi:parvulin-like peptidyl-prolyl isomerase